MGEAEVCPGRRFRQRSSTAYCTSTRRFGRSDDTDARHNQGAQGTDREHSETGSCQKAMKDRGKPGVRFLAQSKRGVRSMPAWLIGGTRQRRRRFCASGWEDTTERVAVWWRSPKDGKLALISRSDSAHRRAGNNTQNGSAALQTIVFPGTRQRRKRSCRSPGNKTTERCTPIPAEEGLHEFGAGNQGDRYRFDATCCLMRSPSKAKEPDAQPNDQRTKP